MSEIRSFVVVGASLAGLRAVEAARKTGHEGTITLIGAEEHLPYDRPPLSKAFLVPTADGIDAEVPWFRDHTTLADELDVKVLLGQPATALDADRRVVKVGDREVSYDALVIATGATPRSIPGTDELAGVLPLRTLDDSRTVRQALKAGARTVVIGAGFIGSEVASSAKKLGVDVTIVEALDTPLVRAVGAEMGHAIASLHERHGTHLLCGTAVRSIRGDNGHVDSVILGDGTILPADLVVVGIGVTPATAWLEDSGLTLADGIVCDERLWTGVDGVYAAGDVASWHNPTLDVRQRMENWTAAAEQGAAAARNALDPANAKPYGTVPYFWSDWYDSRIQMVGTAEAEEVVLVDGTTTDDRWVALYRQGDRLVGALTLNGQSVIMKYRGQIARGVAWADGLEFGKNLALKRRQATAGSTR